MQDLRAMPNVAWAAMRRVIYQAIGIGILPGIAVGRADHQVDPLALRDSHIARFHIFDGAAKQRGHDAGVAQQLFDGARHEVRLAAQARPLRGMAEQGEPAVGQQAGKGLRHAHQGRLAHAHHAVLEDPPQFGRRRAGRGACGLRPPPR